MRRRLPAMVLLSAALAYAGCGEEETTKPSSASQGADACSEAAAPQPKKVKLDRPDLDPPSAGSTVRFETSCGEFVVGLDTEKAPRTTASFANLVEKGVYDGTAFHKVVPGFVIQGGDPAGDGTGGPGYFVDEPPPPDTSYTKGVVAMAKSEAEPPGRSGSQFYVVTGADAGLPTDFALIGEVVEGERTVSAIEDLGIDGVDGAPSRPVVIEKATVEQP